MVGVVTRPRMKTTMTNCESSIRLSVSHPLATLIRHRGQNSWTVSPRMKSKPALSASRSKGGGVTAAFWFESLEPDISPRSVFSKKSARVLFTGLTGFDQVCFVLREDFAFVAGSGVGAVDSSFGASIFCTSNWKEERPYSHQKRITTRETTKSTKRRIKFGT